MGYFGAEPEPVVDVLQHIPLTGLEPNAVLAVNCNGDMIDLAGDAVFDQNPSFVGYLANGSYDGLRDVLDLGQWIGTTTAAAHRVPTASAITYGLFLFTEYTQTANPFPLYSGIGTTSSTRNYGFKIDPGNGGPYEPIPGGPAFSDPAIGVYEKWVHIMITEPAGRATAKLYVNGVFRSSVTSGQPGVMSASDEFWLGSAKNQTNTFLNGYCESVFVADAEYTEAQIRQLAENAFGHVLP